MKTTAPSLPAPATPDLPKAPDSHRLGGLDGLRAIAVLSVLAYHLLPDAAIGGYLGVDVFFVISGFLITTLLIAEHTKAGGISVPRFWLRRARRLLPALALVVLFCGAVAGLLGGDVTVKLGSQVLGAATFSSNWVYIAQGSSYFTDATPELFRTFWSLAVEEQFYLFWPGLLLLVLLLKWRWARVGIVLLAAAASALAMALLFVPPGDATRVYYGTDTHSFGLAIGAGLALLLSSRMPGRRLSRVLSPIGAAAVGALVVLVLIMPADDSSVTRGGLVVVALLTALAIAGAVGENSWLARGLDTAPLRWIGERSYGMYLWHWPVLVLLIAALPVDAQWWIAPSAALALTLLAAALSYRWVEMPIRVSGFRRVAASATGTARRIVAGAVAVAIACALVLTGAAVVADPGATEAQQAIEEGQRAIAEAAAARPRHPGPGRPVPLPRGDQIYAVGDSVMLAASPWLQEHYPGIAIDAAVSRSMWVAPSIVQSIVDAGALRPILVIGLGTNGDVETADLAAVLKIVGDDALIVVVNAQAPQPWIPIGNATLAEFARKERTVELANWHDAIAPRIDELARDQVHPGGPISSGIYIGSIDNALQRLAELPPVLGADDYEYLNRPL